jgi:hypothetical protein
VTIASNIAGSGRKLVEGGGVGGGVVDGIDLEVLTFQYLVTTDRT